MNEIYKDKLEILRQRVSIGLRHGLAILGKVNGDVEQAEKLFQQEMLSLVINKTGVTKAIATKHLIKTNFDINSALKSIDEERYTLTERILKQCKDNKEEALNKLAYAVEQKNKLIRNFWLDLEDLQKLSQQEFCLLTIIEWLHYNDYEGFIVAIHFHLEVVTDQIKEQLLLPEIAGIIRKAKEIHESQFEQQEIKFKKEKAISPTPEFCEQEDLFDEKKPLLIDTLYEFVKKHVNKFP